MTITEMLPSDAAAAAALEREIFPDAWGEKGIAEELRDELYRGYIVCVSKHDLSRDDKADRTGLGDVPDCDKKRHAGGDVLSRKEKTACAAAGYVLVRAVAGEGEILRIGVLPEFRRRGLASRLLEEVFRRADKDVEQWFLEVREHNAAAIALYRSFGFTEVGSRKAYYRDTGEAAILMRRDVLIT